MNKFKTIMILKIKDKGDGKNFLGFTENDKILNLQKKDGHRYIVEYKGKQRVLQPLSLTRYDLFD